MNSLVTFKQEDVNNTYINFILYLSAMSNKCWIFFMVMALNLASFAQNEYMNGFSIDYKNRHDRIFEIQGTLSLGSYFAGVRKLNSYKIDIEKRWYWGYALRINGGSSSGGNFLTANPSITRKSSSILAVLSEPDPFSTDTLQPSKILGGEGAFQIFFQRIINPQVDISFLIDVAGLNFGIPAPAAVNSSAQGAPDAVIVTPSLLSLNLFSDHSRGNIRYELLVRYWLNHKWGLSGGPAYCFRELRSGTPIAGAQRFRRKQVMFNLALVWAPYHKKYKD
jgi:hypothetical protein